MSARKVTMLINFKLAFDNDKNIFLTEIAEKVSQSIVCEFGEGKSFSSLYLSGSLSRGEGSVIKINGRFLMLSDFDFLLVADSLQSARNIYKRIPHFLKELNAQYRHYGLLSAIDCGVATRDSLFSLEPTLLWYEFINSGKCVAGQDESLADCFTWDVKQISKLEALILIQNRVLEQLIYLPRNFKDEGLDEDRFLKVLYLCARSFCDIAKSYLLHRGVYDDSAQGRLQQLKSLSDPALPPELIEHIEFWTGFKINPRIEAVLNRFGRARDNEAQVLQGIAKQLYSALTAFWKIEAEELFKMSFTTLGKELWAIKTAGSCICTKEWLRYGKRELHNKRILPLHKMPYYILRGQTPLWVSHLSGMILYDAFFKFRNNGGKKSPEVSDQMLSVARHLPYAFLKVSAKNGFLNDWNNLRIKTLTIWNIIALGGRQEIPF